MNVVGYVRVSTQEQASSGVGLDAQRDAIRAECERRDWSLVRIAEDRGASGRDLRRPGVQEALDDLRGGAADTLMVAKLDRLSRSMVDFAGLMARAQREEWAIVALDCAVDTTTPAGEAMAHVLATFAQFERRLIGQRTKEALAVKRAQGVRLGAPPSIPTEVADRIRREREAGTTLQAIADGLNRDGVATPRGGRCWRPSSFQSCLGTDGRS